MFEAGKLKSRANCKWNKRVVKVIASPRFALIAHFTVSNENEAGVDLVLIQTVLLYYVNQVFLMLTTNFLE